MNAILQQVQHHTAVLPLALQAELLNYALYLEQKTQSLTPTLTKDTKEQQRKRLAEALEQLAAPAIALRQQRKMSLGDALIAAACLEHQLPLATANEKDFDWVEGLEMVNPLAGWIAEE